MRWSFRAVVFGAALIAACGSKKPKVEPPPEPEPEPVAPPPKPPPPPKKCESMDEDCVADAKTKARVARSAFVFTPVTGWKYAQLDAVTVVEPFEIGAASAFTVFDVDPKKDKDSRDSALTDVAKSLSLTLPKPLRLNWKKPDPKSNKTIGDLKASAWQIEDVKRGDKKGSLLIVSAPVEASKALLAIGFVPSEDKSGADEAIMTSIDSISPAPAKDAKDDKDKGK